MQRKLLFDDMLFRINHEDAQTVDKVLKRAKKMKKIAMKSWPDSQTKTFCTTHRLRNNSNATFSDGIPSAQQRLGNFVMVFLN